MGSWVIRWNFDREAYEPGQSSRVNFWLENTSDTNLHLSDLRLMFDFGTYNLETIGGVIPPRANKSLGGVNLALPKDVVGRKIFTADYQMREQVNNEWVDLGTYQFDKQYDIGVYPKPFYKVFVSRGLSPEDKAIGDPITEMIREWGFRTATVGIEIIVPDEEVAIKTREEVKTSDAVLAIATPRSMDAITGLWRTLEWHHGEVGIAFGVDKPLLILKDRRVSLGGLPSYLPDSYPLLEFDPYALDHLRTLLPTIMPGFREWIETKRRKNFFESLGKVLSVVGAVVVISGILGVILGASKK